MHPRRSEEAEHRWWETLLGWSPTAAGALTVMLHPVVVLLVLALLWLLLLVILDIKVWPKMKQIMSIQHVKQMQ